MTKEPVLDLVDRLIELDRIKSYLEISPDEEIESYAKKHWDVVIKDKQELKNFYQETYDSIANFGNLDVRAKNYLEDKIYREKLEKVLLAPLPRIEKIDNPDLSFLEKPLEIMVDYIWRMSTKDNYFEMNYAYPSAGVEDITLYLKSNNPYLRIALEGSERYFQVEIVPVYKTRIYTVSKERKFLFWNIRGEVETKEEELNELKDLKIELSQRHHCCYIQKCGNIKKFLDNVEEYLLKEPTIMEDFEKYSRIIWRLPKVIADYIKKENEKTKKINKKLRESVKRISLPTENEEQKLIAN